MIKISSHFALLRLLFLEIILYDQAIQNAVKKNLKRRVPKCPCLVTSFDHWLPIVKISRVLHDINVKAFLGSFFEHEIFTDSATWKAKHTLKKRTIQ